MKIKGPVGLLKLVWGRIARFWRFDVLVTAVNWISILSFLTYVASMVIIPAFRGSGSWEYMQTVWYSWQTLNAGILAFIASVIAFNISKYQENKQRERKFIAARAFLPHALSELMGYFKQSASLLLESWERLEHPRMGPVLMAEEVPQPPDSYKQTFSHCIEHADANVGDYLAMVLMRLPSNSTSSKSRSL